MKTISNGVQTLTVTGGAYDSYYKLHGWAEIVTPPRTSESPLFSPPISKEVSLPHEDEDVKIDQNSEVSEDDTDAEEGTDLEDETEDEELAEKPIGTMSYEELARYATQLDIDIAGLNSKKLLREAIKASQE